MTNDRPRAKKTVRRKGDRAIRQRAEQLHDQGMPFQMAMAVAHGRMDLSEALERMSRKDRVERLITDHELSRALATQVAMGHVDLEVILRRRALDTHRAENRDKTVLTAGRRLTLALHGKRVATGVVGDSDAYLFRFTPDSGEEEEVHKLQVKLAYDPDDWKKAKKAIKTDKALAKSPKEPIPRPQDRYGCSDRRLFGYMDRGIEVTMTLLEGEVVRGTVAWFSRYEIGMRARGEVEVVVFRHALHDVK